MGLRGLTPKVSSISGRLRRAPRPLMAAPQAATIPRTVGVFIQWLSRETVLAELLCVAVRLLYHTPMWQ